MTDEIERSNLLAYQDCLLYLRALFYFSTGKIKESFEDFYSIDSKEIFPINLIEDEIWSSLSPSQKEMIKEEKFYKNSFEYKKIAQTIGKKNTLVNQNSIEELQKSYVDLEDLCLKLF